MNHYVTKITYIVYLAILLLSTSCKTAVIDTAKDTDIVLVDMPKIAFITYRISKDQDDQKSVELVDLLKVDGKFKSQENEKTRAKGDYELIQLDNDGKQLAITIVENPLSQTVEYVNSNGEFAKKNIDFKSKETAVRVQLNSKTYYILMQEIGNESTNFLKTKI